MSRELKPGDLLTDEIGSPFFVVEVTANSRAAWREGVHAVDADGNGWRVDSIEGARRLVVIDPEDREQVERLCDLFLRGNDGTAIGDANDLQAALREFANPTPVEPTGLGAVVEDAVGRVWVRHDNTPGSFPWVRAGRGVAGWSEINAVRVLSVGVTA
jgi:hypothetical protein